MGVAYIGNKLNSLDSSRDVDHEVGSVDRKCFSFGLVETLLGLIYTCMLIYHWYDSNDPLLHLNLRRVNFYWASNLIYPNH